MDSPDFTWRTKNFLWGELNVLRRGVFVKRNKPPMITDSNQVCKAKMVSPRVQEVILFFPKASWPKVQFGANTYKSLIGVAARVKDYW